MKITKYDIFAVVLDTIVITFISLVFYLAKDIHTSKIVYIPKGSVNKIITYLEDRNFEIFRLDAYLMRFFGKPQSGWIDMGKTYMSKADFLHKLTHSKAALTDIKLIPGETKEIFFKNIAKKLHLSYYKLLEEYRKNSDINDGVILPDTYKIPVGMSERHLVSYLINLSLYKHEKLSKKIFGYFDKKRWFKYITIASIIQKEAANKKEMGLISAVIHNRLKKGMKLQMDGTLNYGLNSHKKITAKRLKNDNSPYNTYKIKGLPPYPICSVSLEAIKAAIFPPKKKYLYFVKDKSGKHRFSTTYKAHLRNIKR